MCFCMAHLSFPSLSPGSICYVDINKLFYTFLFVTEGMFNFLSLNFFLHVAV